MCVCVHIVKREGGEEKPIHRIHLKNKTGEHMPRMIGTYPIAPGIQMQSCR